MNFAATLTEINQMPLEDRLRMVQAIWDSIAAEPKHLHLTDEQKVELDRRLAAHEANPKDVVPWEQVKADAKARMGT